MDNKGVASKDTKLLLPLRVTPQEFLQIKDKIVKLNQPREFHQSRFQKSLVGVIYEEMSILDTFDDACVTDIPLMFEKTITLNHSEALSDVALNLKPKIHNITSCINGHEKFNKKKQRTTKESSNVVPNSMKLTELLGSSVPIKSLLRIESLTRSSKLGGRLARLLFERQSCKNSVMRYPLPSIKASPQPEKNVLKTGYLQLCNFKPNKETHEARSSSNTAAKQRRPKSGEKRSMYSDIKQQLKIKN